jgi:dihydrolipoamide dehydrogenase
VRETDVLIVGAGPGGYVAAIRAAQLGLRTLLVERDFLGGVCLNVGCIPSKALISASKSYRKLADLEAIGITVEKVSVDWKRVVEWRGEVVKKLTGGVKQLLKGNGAEVLMGTAKLTGPNEAEVDTGNGKERVRFKHAILATGSHAVEIPGFKFDGKKVISSTEALELPKVPKRLVIIGAGVIGLEIGCFYRNFGSEVTVLELLDQVLPGTDKEVAETMRRLLKKQGIDVHLRVKANGAKPTSKGVTVTYEEDGKESSVEADVCLVAVGRRANVKDIGLEAAGVKVHEKGFVEVDEYCRTNVKHIHAIGDLVGLPQLAHKASKEGIVAAERIAGKPAARDFATVPGVIFTDPEIASAGLTEEEAKEKGHDVAVGKFPFAASGRAMTTLETDGFVKVLSDKKTGLLLGVHIIGPEASDLISEAALALEMGATAEDLSLTVHPHPTLGEAVMEAAEDAQGMAVHVLKRKGGKS